MKFYHYPHCPFCQRVRLALAYKGVDYEDIVLSYADAETPTALVGAKMLPIIDFGDGTVSPESLDLVAALEERFPERPLYFENTDSDLEWASRAVIGIPSIFDMLLPYYLDGYKEAGEFDSAGVEYYVTKKETRRGRTFDQLKAERFAIFETSVLPALEQIEAKLDDGFVGEVFSAADCVLAADLSGLRLVEDITLPPAITAYISAVENVCGEALL